MPVRCTDITLPRGREAKTGSRATPQRHGAYCGGFGVPYERSEPKLDEDDEGRSLSEVEGRSWLKEPKASARRARSSRWKARSAACRPPYDRLRLALEGREENPGEALDTWPKADIEALLAGRAR